MRTDKQRQPRSCGARTVLDISRGRRARSSACCASHRIVESYTVCTVVGGIRVADLDPELDLGCLPYRERFASGAPDEVHFDKGKNKTLEQYVIKEKRRKKLYGNQKAKKTEAPEPDVGGSGGRAVGRTGRQTNSP